MTIYKITDSIYLARAAAPSSNELGCTRICYKTVTSASAAINIRGGRHPTSTRRGVHRRNPFAGR